jgi:hypothetical protein
VKITSLSLSLACGALLAAQSAAEYRVSGPFTHENLSLFLIHGKTGGKTYLTLMDAVAQKKVRVHETKQVNELTVENVSDEAVYIQGGDIVKGGQQDRVISNDFILPAKSGKLPLSAFCVEQGRWSQRGAESAGLFSSSSQVIAGKNLKLAVKSRKDQAEVWREVAKAQYDLSASLEGGTGAGMAQSVAATSPTSLQLTLESRPVRKAVERYLTSLSGVASGKRDVVGFAFAVNGVINSADVYSSPALFAAMWPKLLRSSAVEAAARLRKGDRFQPVTAGAIRTFLEDSESGRPSEVDVDSRVKLMTYTGEKHILFESRDGSGVLHRNYILN